MRFTYNWLNEFVEIKLKPQALAQVLTMAGLEVVFLEEKEGDFVFEIEITSNRPDLLSIIGIAREVAALTGKKLKLGSFSLKSYRGFNSNFKIEIEDRNDCLLYNAKIIKNIKVGSSPDWLKQRLELVGCRSINNIVDITNYVMFVWGQPLHAFDLDKLDDCCIIVRRAKDKEELITLDGQKRILDPQTLIIADKKKALALAGIIGGENSQISQNTQHILLEAAIFNPLIIRRTRQRLGIQTESAYRFERGLEPQILKSASWEAVDLMRRICGGMLILDKTQGRPKKKDKIIYFNSQQVKRSLGIEIDQKKIITILVSLGFKVKKQKKALKIGIPSYRKDISLEMDIVEEIARIYGYENIPTSLPKVLTKIEPDLKRTYILKIKDILIGLGLDEVLTYSLTDKETLKDFGLESKEAVSILNPLSKEQEVLRTSLLPSLLNIIIHNLNQKQNYVRIFEIAHIFSFLNDRPQEELSLGLGIAGVKPTLTCQGLIKEEMGFLHLKGIIQMLLDRLGIDNYSFKLNEKEGIDLYLGKERIGFILMRSILKNKKAYLAEISLTRLFGFIRLEKRFTPFPVYPAIIRDISFILKEGTFIEELIEEIRRQGQPFLKEARVIDFYKGKQVPPGFQGLTISCLYRSDERTLTEEEVNPLHDGVVKMVVEKFNARIR
ncbi:MAG: phenylalanine--tRNA ligase subunit beta [Candidatus Omnitrophica bacterium]|nr:phenylalanine--tRNA ligase subunit beta [Candidatus Omnitrophota bacterium]